MKAISAAVALVVMSANGAIAGEFGCPCCQSCGGACVLKVEQVEEEETCYEVECKEVCIPAVRFPWDRCRTPKCGRVRVVSKLKEDKTTKTACKYEWVLTCSRCGRPAAAIETKDACMKPADRTPPAPSMPPMPPAANAAWPQQGRRQRAAKSQAVGVVNYIGRSSTR